MKRSDKWWVVAAMSLPLFILTVDVNGAFVALPEIGLDLNASTSSLQWVMNAYLLAFAAVLLPIGRVADVVGRRRVLLAGVILFGTASLVNGLAPNEVVLIAGRAVQAVGAAMFFATSLSIVTGVFPQEERARGIGIWTAIGASGAAAGPIIGGVLTELLSWRWFFFVNIPIVVGAVFLTLAVVPESRDETAERHVDLLGFFTSALGIVALVFGIQEGPESGWDSPLVIGSLAAAAALLVGFVVVEMKVRDPLFELDLFKGRDFVSANVVAASQNATFFGVSFFLTLYLQNVEGLSALETGIVFVAITVPFVVTSTFVAHLYTVLGDRWGMALGMLLGALSALLLATLDIDTTLLIVLVGFAILGVGMSLAYNIGTTAGMSAIPDEKSGAASGILSSARFVGPAIGLAAAGAIFQAVENSRLATELNEQVPSLSDEQVDDVQGLLSGSPEAVQQLDDLSPADADRIEAVVQDVFIPAQTATMIFVAAVAAAGVAAALFYRGGSAPPND